MGLGDSPSKINSKYHFFSLSVISCPEHSTPETESLWRKLGVL